MCLIIAKEKYHGNVTLINDLPDRLTTLVLKITSPPIIFTWHGQVGERSSEPLVLHVETDYRYTILLDLLSYVKTVINNTEEADDPVDSDGMY